MPFFVIELRDKELVKELSTTLVQKRISFSVAQDICKACPACAQRTRANEKCMSKATEKENAVTTGSQTDKILPLRIRLPGKRALLLAGGPPGQSILSEPIDAQKSALVKRYYIGGGQPLGSNLSPVSQVPAQAPSSAKRIVCSTNTLDTAPKRKPESDSPAKVALVSSTTKDSGSKENANGSSVIESKDQPSGEEYVDVINSQPLTPSSGVSAAVVPESVCQCPPSIASSSPCRLCKTSVGLRSSTVTRHCLQHMESRPYYCPLCFEEFMREDSNISHFEMRHRDVPRVPFKFCWTDVKENLLQGMKVVCFPNYSQNISIRDLTGSD